ncbi:unnamed protein product [Auanema sp. JU1783]|nr:unnamed protein product [Auanema sp. JU1783]
MKMNRDSLDISDFSFDLEEDDRNQSLISAIYRSIQDGNFMGLVVLTVIISVIVLVIVICYLMMRFMHRALSGGESKGPYSSPYANMVIHSKRVYEIQAEEGCFAGPESEPTDSKEPSATIVEPEEEKSPRASLRRPETGDLRQIRAESPPIDDPRQMIRKKDKKIHKDSVCGLMFRQQHQSLPNMV